MERMLYFLLVCFCILITLYQCVQLLDLYFRYPFTVSISTVGKSSFQFPGITLCTTAFVSKERVMQGCKNDQKMTDCFADFVAKEPLTSILNQSLDMADFIADVRCAADEIDDNVTCQSNLHESVIKTFQGNSVCWTLFHKATIAKSRLAQIHVPTGYKQSALLIEDEGVNMNLFNQSIQPREVIRFLINFTNKESVMSDEPVYGTAGVHDPSLVRQSRRGSMKIFPGRFYEISYEEHKTISLPAPYGSNCFAYNRQNMIKHTEEEETNPFAIPLSSSDCFVGCMGVNTLQQSECLCWPPEVPFMTGDPDFTPLVDGDCFLCNWLTFAKSSEKVLRHNYTNTEEKSKVLVNIGLDYFRNCSASFEQECKRSCRKACETLRMKVTTSESTWPSDEEIKAVPAGSPAREELQHFRDCCTIVSLKYASTDIVVYTAQAKYEVIEFISYIGGIIGLWMGFTFVGLIDYVKSAIHILHRVRGEYVRRKERISSIGASCSMDKEKMTTLGRRRKTRERLPWYFETVDQNHGANERDSQLDKYRRNSHFRCKFHVDSDSVERPPVIYQ